MAGTAVAAATEGSGENRQGTGCLRQRVAQRGPRQQNKTLI